MSDQNDQQTNPDDVKPDGKQGEQGFKPIESEAELSAWKDGVRKSIAADVRKQLQDEQDAKDAKAKKDAEDKAAVERGEAQKVIDEQAGKLTATESERDTLKAENEAITAYFTAQYDAAIKELPEVITAFAPAEDASFAVKSDWLTKAQAQAAKIDGTTTPGNRPNPKPGDGTRDLDAAAQQARASGKYTV